LLPIKMINFQTDRIYLASDTGLIQCLHEIELPQPLNHLRAQTKAAEEAQDGDEQEAVEDAQPKPEPAKPEEGPGDDKGMDPLGGGDDDPFKI
jgi:hypothetical protein